MENILVNGCGCGRDDRFLIGVTKPEDMKSDISELMKVIQDIEGQFKKSPKGRVIYTFLVNCDSSIIANKIHKIYADAGWHICHNGPKDGKYEFSFYQTKSL